MLSIQSFHKPCIIGAFAWICFHAFEDFELTFDLENEYADKLFYPHSICGSGYDMCQIHLKKFYS